MFVTLVTLICCAVSPASAEHNILRLAKEVNESMISLIGSTSASLDDTHLDQLGEGLMELVIGYVSDAAVEVTELDVGHGFDVLLASEARMLVELFAKFAPSDGPRPIFPQSTAVRKQVETTAAHVQVGSAALRYISQVPFDKAHRLAGNESSIIKSLCQTQPALLEANVASSAKALCSFCPEMRHHPLRSACAYIQLAQIAQFTAYVACGRFSTAPRERQIRSDYLLSMLKELRGKVNDCCRKLEPPVEYLNQPFCSTKPSPVFTSTARNVSAHIVISANETSQELRVHLVAQSFSNLESVSIASTAENLATNILKESTSKKLVFMTGQTNYPLVASTQQIGNAFLGAVITAWANHYALELSPDDFWTAILQGVAQYLSRKDVAEKYRYRFVDHAGKKTLTVFIHESVLNGGMTEEQAAAAYSHAIMKFGDKIRNNTKGDIAEVSMRPFSTSKPVELTVFSASLMTAMRNYFHYRLVPVCGIPVLRLHGTIEDYEDIVDRIDTLLKLFDDLILSSWLKRIRSDMSRILEIRNGTVGDDHITWLKQIVVEKEIRHDPGCTSSLAWHEVTGWIGDFVLPCERSRECRTVADLSIDTVWGTPAITLADVELTCHLLRFVSSRSLNEGQVSVPRLPPVQFPTLMSSDGSYSSVFVSAGHYLSLSGKKLADLKLAAGFVGLSQNSESKAVRPALGWMLFNASDVASTSGQ